MLPTARGRPRKRGALHNQRSRRSRKDDVEGENEAPGEGFIPLRQDFDRNSNLFSDRFEPRHFPRCEDLGPGLVQGMLIVQK